MAVVIRLASLQDAAAMHKVETGAFPPERRESLETLKMRQRLFPAGCVVLEYNGTMAAFSEALLVPCVSTLAELEPPDGKLHGDSGGFYYIRNLAVAGKFRGKGFGRLLAEWHVRNAQRLGKKAIVFTASKDVEGFYSKLGFRRVAGYKEFHNAKQALWKMGL